VALEEDGPSRNEHHQPVGNIRAIISPVSVASTTYQVGAFLSQVAILLDLEGKKRGFFSNRGEFSYR